MDDFEVIYENVPRRNFAPAPQRLNKRQDEGKDRKQRGRVCLVLMTVSLGLICALLLVFIIWLNISITAERDLLKRYETTVQEFNHIINSLQTNYTDLRTEKDRLKKSLDRKTSYNKLKITKGGWLLISTEAMNWSESRQFCRDRGADLVMIKTREKQIFISLLVKRRVWIGLNDIQQEGNMTWVDDSPLKQGFWLKGEPNDERGNEDCIELMPENPFLNNWNDLPCSEKRIGMCEK